MGLDGGRGVLEPGILSGRDDTILISPTSIQPVDASLALGFSISFPFSFPWDIRTQKWNGERGRIETERGRGGDREREREREREGETVMNCFDGFLFPFSFQHGKTKSIYAQ